MTKPQKQAADAFPFIRFTNWKQVGYCLALVYVIVKSFHSYASRIGSKRVVTPSQGMLYRVSIHTLNELEARFAVQIAQQHGLELFGFHSYASRIGSKKRNLSRSYAQYKRVSIHTLHELEASSLYSLDRCTAV